MVAIFVALMFVGLVLTDLLLEKTKAWRAARALQPVAGRTLGFDAWQVPEGVHLSNAHTWARPDPTGGLEIGADALIAHAMGAVERIILPVAGEQVEAGQPLFRLEREGRTAIVPSNITGRVTEVNGNLLTRPGLLNADPYGIGWVCRVVPTSVAGVAPQVRFGEKAATWLETEFARLGEFLSARVPAMVPVGATSQDGGLPSAGCLAELDQKAWSEFETEFLRMG